MTDDPAPSVSDEGSSPPSDDAWAMAGRDAARTHASATPIRPPLRELWRVPVPEGHACCVRLADARNVYVLLQDGRSAARGPEYYTGAMSLLALDARTGAETWRTELPGHHLVFPWPVLTGDRVWILDSVPGAHQLVSVDLLTGLPHAHAIPTGWRDGIVRVLSGPVYGPGPWTLSELWELLVPLAIDGRLVGIRGQQRFTRDDLRACCYTIPDGRQCPDWDLCAQTGMGGLSWLAGLGDLVVGPSANPDYPAPAIGFWEVGTGRLVRRTLYPGPNVGLSTESGMEGLCARMDGSMLFASYFGGTLAVRPDGDVAWQAEDAVSLSVVGGGALFCRTCAPEERGRYGPFTWIAALADDSGQVLWRESSVDLLAYSQHGLWPGSILLAGDTLWANDVQPETSDARRLVALSADTGEVLWSQAACYNGDMIAAHGRLFGTVAATPYGTAKGGAIVALAHDDT